MTATVPNPLDHLRIERRSYIVGTLVVWAVALLGIIYLFSSMEPAVFAAARSGETMQQAMTLLQQLPPLTPNQQLLIDAIMLVGGVALFFLNWRFSLVLLRPRRAFLHPEQGGSSAVRWAWWVVLALNSLLYVTIFVSQLVLTFVLAWWGKQEIRRRAAGILPVPIPPPGGSST